MKSFTYTIVDPVGIHARPAGLLVKTAKAFSGTEISVTKKNALGVRGMKLTGEDRIHHAYLLESRQEYAIEYHDKPYGLNKVKLAKRDTKGVKPRV